jgi:hypothetical protein
MRQRMTSAMAGLALLSGLPAVAADGPLAAEPATQEAAVSPEERMRRRFPQPVRVGDLIGLPVLDDYDSTIGRIKLVVRTDAGKILLIVPYEGLFGFGRRLVPVPIEAVAILGRQVAALDMPREAFDTAPTWYGSGSVPLGKDDIIRIAITSR